MPSRYTTTSSFSGHYFSKNAYYLNFSTSDHDGLDWSEAQNRYWELIEENFDEMCRELGHTHTLHLGASEVYYDVDDTDSEDDVDDTDFEEIVREASNTAYEQLWTELGY